MTPYKRMDGWSNHRIDMNRNIENQYVIESQNHMIKQWQNKNPSFVRSENLLKWVHYRQYFLYLLVSIWLADALCTFTVFPLIWGPGITTLQQKASARFIQKWPQKKMLKMRWHMATCCKHKNRFYMGPHNFFPSHRHQYMLLWG